MDKMAGGKRRENAHSAPAGKTARAAAKNQNSPATYSMRNHRLREREAEGEKPLEKPVCGTGNCGKRYKGRLQWTPNKSAGIKK